MAKAWKLIDEGDARSSALIPTSNTRLISGAKGSPSNPRRDVRHPRASPDAQLFIPNRRVYEELMGYLREAERLAASHSGQTYFNAWRS